MNKYLKQYSGISSKILVAVIIPLLIVAGFIFKGDGVELIIHQPSGDRVFQGEVAGNMSVLDSLSFATSAGNIEFKYAIDSSGVDVYRLGDYVSGFGELSLKINGKDFEYNKMDKKMVSGGDQIEFFIELDR